LLQGLSKLTVRFACASIKSHLSVVPLKETQKEEVMRFQKRNQQRKSKIQSVITMERVEQVAMDRFATMAVLMKDCLHSTKPLKTIGSTRSSRGDNKKNRVKNLKIGIFGATVNFVG
jgi:hypothetical protein